jgi:TolB-like protein
MGLMGRLLGLDVLVEGTVQKLDEQLRITARLVDVHTGRLIWAETYDQPALHPAGAEEAVGRAVTAEVGKRLLQDPRRISE